MNLQPWPAAALLLLASLFAPAAGLAGTEPLVVEATATRLDVERPELDRVGALRALTVLELTSRDDRFGGLSGLLIDPGGRYLEAVTDQGKWITMALAHDGSGRLTGVGAARIAALTRLDGRAMTHKGGQDAESLAFDAAPSTALIVSFEQRHRIWRYAREEDGLSRYPTALPTPPGIEEAPPNEGLEALERLADGRLLAIGSKMAREGLFPAFVWNGDAWQRLWYRRTAPFEPTGAGLLPDGDVLILERRFSILGGLGVRIGRLAAADIRPGAILESRELARIESPLTVDNFEGIATRRGPGGETLVYLLSDDNFNLLQRTLLLQFVLED